MSWDRTSKGYTEIKTFQDQFRDVSVIKYPNSSTKNKSSEAIVFKNKLWQAENLTKFEVQHLHLNVHAVDNDKKL